MSVACSYLSYSIIVLLLSSSEISLAAESVVQKATVFGTPAANLRAGAGIEYALKVTLKEGDTVTIEKSEGDWYLVITLDGQQGYIHKNLLKPVENLAAQSQVTPTQSSSPVVKPAGAPATGNAPTVPATATVAVRAPLPMIAPVEAVKTSTMDRKAPSLLQMLEGRELEAKIGLVAAVVTFVIGWFCGGHYYIRREHKHRRRLRL